MNTNSAVVASSDLSTPGALGTKSKPGAVMKNGTSKVQGGKGSANGKAGSPAVNQGAVSEDEGVFPGGTASDEGRGVSDEEENTATDSDAGRRANNGVSAVTIGRSGVAAR